LHGEAQRVRDRAGRRLVVAREPGKIGRPAASALVQPGFAVGRTLLESRWKIAPAAASQPPFGCGKDENIS
jgi:hypothetical protein